MSLLSLLWLSRLDFPPRIRYLDTPCRENSTKQFGPSESEENLANEVNDIEKIQLHPDCPILVETIPSEDTALDLFL